MDTNADKSQASQTPDPAAPESQENKLPKSSLPSPGDSVPEVSANEPSPLEASTPDIPEKGASEQPMPAPLNEVSKAKKESPMEESTAEPVSQTSNTPTPSSDPAPFSMPEPVKSKAPLVLMAFASAAMIIGLVALFVGFSGKNRSGANLELVAQNKEQAIELEHKLAGLNGQIEALTEENNRLETQMRTMAQQIQIALEKIGQEMTITRNQISTLDGALTAAVKAMSKASTLPSQSQASKKEIARLAKQAPAPAPQEPGVSGMKEYRIEQGDTLAALSHRFNIPLPKLLDVNPDVDPKRLQVGQKILVPMDQQG